jgi:nucleotide-binding universal stress UspA family protein
MMYNRILIPTDGSPLAQQAIEQGIKFARAMGAKVCGMTATPNLRVASRYPFGADELAAHELDMEAAARQALDAVIQAAAVADVPCAVRHVVGQEPFEAIIQVARDEACDLIFMASHRRRGVSAFLLGSETRKVLTHSTIPVLVCR